MTAKELEPAPTNRDHAPALSSPHDERVIDSRTLFGQARAIRITHNGEWYLLRLTRLGKLILTK